MIVLSYFESRIVYKKTCTSCYVYKKAYNCSVREFYLFAPMGMLVPSLHRVYQLSDSASGFGMCGIGQTTVLTPTGFLC